MDFIIRKATIKDIPVISMIKVKGWQTAYKGMIDDDYLNNMNINRTIEKNTKSFDRYPFVVAESNNEIIGFCGFDYGNIEDLDDNCDCELRGIYVRPDLKRNGIGKKLIRYVMNLFLRADKRKMILWCLKENIPSRKFYETMGGKESSTKTSKFGEKEYEIISYIFELDSELELVFPTKEMQKEIEEYVQEFYDNGDTLNGIGGYTRINNFDIWLDKVNKDLSKKTISQERIPATLYFTRRKSDKRIVGNLQIRHYLDEKLLKYGGHIGDSVRPSERKKGYATEQIRLALKKCKELGIDRVMMDCDKSNIASAKSIMNNSGILENEVMIDGELNQRYWISLKKRYANRYEFQKNTIYKIKSINSDEFTGDVCYYKFKSINRKINISNGTCILDNNYEWLEFYDYNSKIKLSALYNNKKEIIEWYFDIAREIGNENGCPYEDDLYLDVVVNPNGEILLLDEDELKEAFDRLEVSQETYDMAYNEANNLMEKLKGNKDKLEKFTNRYLKDLEVII